MHYICIDIVVQHVDFVVIMLMYLQHIDVVVDNVVVQHNDVIVDNVVVQYVDVVVVMFCTTCRCCCANADVQHVNIVVTCNNVVATMMILLLICCCTTC